MLYFRKGSLVNYFEENHFPGFAYFTQSIEPQFFNGAEVVSIDSVSEFCPDFILNQVQCDITQLLITDDSDVVSKDEYLLRVQDNLGEY